MNLSKTVDTIIDLRSQGAASDEQLAEHFKSILGAANAQVQAQSISTHSRALLMAAVLALSIVFLAAVLKRRHRAALASALAIPLILFLELSVGLHIITWTTQKKSENIIARFPVQDAAREVIIGTRYPEPMAVASGRFTETVSAFLLPMTLVITLLGLWRVAVYFGKFDFEDAHTIAMIMGSVCALYYALAFGVCVNRALSLKKTADPKRNAGSLAVLAALAEDLSHKYPRLENTSVTVAFFGRGRMGGSGAEEFAEKLAREQNRAAPTYFIGCERAGRGGAHGYVLSEDTISESLYTDRSMIRAFNRAAVKTTGRPLEILRGETPDANGFIEQDYPAIVLSTFAPAGKGDGDEGIRHGNIDRGQLLLTLQLLEANLSELDKLQLVHP